MDIAVRNLTKTYRIEGTRRLALDDVSFAIPEGERVALIGSSGSGKSTLLRHLAGLLTADAGEVVVGQHVVQEDGRLGRGLSALRGRIGVIFQQFNLVGRLTVITNVLAGLMAQRALWRTCLFRFSQADREDAMRALGRVGLETYASQRARSLSGGQQQRAAIARVLVQRARLVLADEPIASLDPQSARRVMDCLAAVNREDGVTCVVSLHQVDYALEYFPRIIALSQGKVVYDGPSRDLTRARLESIYAGDSALSPTEAPAGPKLLPV